MHYLQLIINDYSLTIAFKHKWCMVLTLIYYCVLMILMLVIMLPHEIPPCRSKLTMTEKGARHREASRRYYHKFELFPHFFLLFVDLTCAQKQGPSSRGTTH